MEKANEMNNHPDSRLFEHPGDFALSDRAIDLEKVVIGGCLIESDTCKRFISLMNPEYFFLEVHRNIVKTMHAMVADDEPIDIITVIDKMKRLGYYTDHSIYYVTTLSGLVNSTGNMEFWLRVIFEKYVVRQAKLFFQQGLQELEEIHCDAWEVVPKILTKLSRLIDQSPAAMHSQSLEAVMQLTISEMEQRRKAQQDGLTGINTGFATLNALTGGWQNGQEYIIAGRTSAGKSAVSFFFAREAARTGKHVVIFSLEMTPARIGDRLLLGETPEGVVDSRKFALGQISDEQADTLKSVSQEMIRVMPMTINDNSLITASQVCAIVKSLHVKQECDLLIVDYLQLLRPEGGKRETREQEVALCSRLMKALSMSINIPVLLLSQLNREVESRGDLEPRLSDLRESGAIEQDADMVILLHRPALYGKEEDYHTHVSSKNLLVLNVAKNRNGKTERQLYHHSDDMTKFCDYDPTHEDTPDMSNASTLARYKRSKQMDKQMDKGEYLPF